MRKCQFERTGLPEQSRTACKEHLDYARCDSKGLIINDLKLKTRNQKHERHGNQKNHSTRRGYFG
jgi:hypothetical protein